MTVKITKPALNLREELNKLDKPSGITGESLLRADTAADAKETLGIDNFEQVSVSTDGVISADGLRVDTGGTIGIGTSSPARPLHVVGTGETARFESTNATSKIVIKDNLASNEITSVNGKLSIEADTAGLISNSRIDFKIDNSEVARFTDTGRLGLGTSSPVGKLDITDSITSSYGFVSQEGSLVIKRQEAYGTQGHNLVLQRAANSDGTAPSILFAHQYGGPNSGEIRANQLIGRLFFDGWSPAASDYVRGAEITVKAISSVWTSTSSPADILFSTTASGATSPSERMRLTSDGRLGLGTSSPLSTLHIDSSSFNDHLTITRSGNGVSHTQSGTVASISAVGSTNKYQMFGSNLVLDIANTQVGIGTISPSANLHVSSSGDTIARITSADGNGAFLDLGDASDPDGGRIVYDSGSNLAFSTQSTERMRIDSQGRLGLGTSSPETALHLYSTGNTIARITSGTSSIAGLDLGDTAGTDVGRIRYDNSNNSLAFTVATNEAMRIDSSGNLLVGTTDTNVSDNTTGGGININGDGEIKAAKNGTVLNLNRLTTDGEILRFKRGGTTTVGSIGNNSGGMYIGSGDTGVTFEASLNSIIPTNTSSGSYTNGQVDIGYSTTKFKDLYLSGGAYLGGVAAANKLDDYEEGTFTASLEFGGASTGITYIGRTGRYVKIGKLVYINIALNLSSKGTATGIARVTGLPFTQSSEGTNFPNLNLRSVGGITFTTCLYATADDGQSRITLLRDNGSGTQGTLSDADFTTSAEFNITGVYEAA